MIIKCFFEYAMLSSSSSAEICWRAQEKRVGNGKSMYNQSLVILWALGQQTENSGHAVGG